MVSEHAQEILEKGSQCFCFRLLQQKGELEFDGENKVNPNFLSLNCLVFFKCSDSKAYSHLFETEEGNFSALELVVKTMNETLTFIPSSWNGFPVSLIPLLLKRTQSGKP